MPATLRPNRGLYLGRAPLDIPQGGLSAGENFSIDNGKLNNLNLGYSTFHDLQLAINVAGTDNTEPVLMIDSFFDRDSNQTLMFGGDKNIFRYDDAGPELVLMTPTYATGTVDVSAANPAVVTDASGSPTWETEGIKAGDYIHFGSAAQTDPTAVWYQVASVDAEDQLTLTGAVTGAPLTGETYTILKTFTGDLNNPWEAVTFLHEADGDEDWWIVTNGVDHIHKWNGTGNLTTLTTDFKAYHLAVYKNMLIALACTESGEFLPAQMRNSDVGDPDDFTNGLASTFTVHDDSDPIDAALPLGDVLVLYCARHIVMADFVGDPAVFAFRTAVANLGPLGARLVGDFGDNHTFMGPDGLYNFDGVTVPEVGEQVWRDIIRRRDPQRFVRGFSAFDEENGRLIWAVPLSSDVNDDGPEVAFSEHYLEETDDDKHVYSKRDFPFTAAGFFEREDALTWDQISETWEEIHYRFNDNFFEAAFPFLLVGDADGNIYTLNTAQTANGAAMASFVRTGRWPTHDGKMRALVTRVYTWASRLAANTAHQVRLRLFDHANTSLPAVQDEQLYDLSLNEGEHFTSHFRRGRFMELEFRQDNGAPWEVVGWDFDVRPGGMR